MRSHAFLSVVLADAAKLTDALRAEDRSETSSSTRTGKAGKKEKRRRTQMNLGSSQKLQPAPSDAAVQTAAREAGAYPAERARLFAQTGASRRRRLRSQQPRAATETSPPPPLRTTGNEENIGPRSRFRLPVTARGLRKQVPPVPGQLVLYPLPHLPRQNRPAAPRMRPL